MFFILIKPLGSNLRFIKLKVNKSHVYYHLSKSQQSIKESQIPDWKCLNCCYLVLLVLCAMQRARHN